MTWIVIIKIVFHYINVMVPLFNDIYVPGKKLPHVIDRYDSWWVMTWNIRYLKAFLKTLKKSWHLLKGYYISFTVAFKYDGIEYVKG